MRDLQAIADRVEIEALRGEFTDSAMSRDYDRFANLFTVDGVWRIPGAAEFFNRADIRAGIERLQGGWEFFTQSIHPGAVELKGDTATGRVYVEEFGRFKDGRSHRNYSVYHDRYLRTSDGWRFAERVYEMRYQDDSPLLGEAVRPNFGLNPAYFR
ncbi:nuclear transport factor 2 family protein [Kibdelosporangium philippinense]|uniref:Nuclear transport factor 2 family protein n=1 Tax=Kibdelosporangium philippinense TaxID=211113 RepID=A0ABS8ZRD1_9PSEU|nr:nuclear transport factor 2 family protein [Kibdelosporangium philippinense]MCE7010274.1 nuclear transport factor 2 family protein [Kibdelosporangium philippinense]